jgi:hypothetical protein
VQSRPRLWLLRGIGTAAIWRNDFSLELRADYQGISRYTASSKSAIRMLQSY